LRQPARTVKGAKTQLVGAERFEVAAQALDELMRGLAPRQAK
jgi:hypothetical protein